MKTTIIAALLALSISTTYAGDLPESIKVTKCGDDCVQLETRNEVVVRVYGCGKVEKLTWQMLNPNEDPLSISTGNLQFITDTGTSGTWTTESSYGQ